MTKEISSTDICSQYLFREIKAIFTATETILHSFSGARVYSIK